MTDTSHAAETTRQQATIDAGATGERSGGFDPAAAPMGPDQEAGGAVSPASTQDVGSGHDSARKNAAEPELAPDGRLDGDHGGSALAAALGAAGGIAVGLVLLAVLS